MQAIAREFNLSETTFPIRTSVPGADYRLRIFTPTNELPFAGHPSVGSAWLLHSIGRITAGRVVQDCLAGVLPLDVATDDVTLTGATPTIGDAIDTDVLCAAVGLDAADVVADLARLTELSDGGPDRAGVAVLSWADGFAHARVFATGVGVPEDPATGSAALGLGVWLVDTGLLAGEGKTSYDIAQGAEMLRPSQLSCVVRAEGGQAVECQVSGRVRPVANGRIAIP
jgi:trans-2,3-dihydro-3-hydroxyanthranilate isomerase